MEFYKSIVAVYDYIFPLNIQQIDFVEDVLEDTNAYNMLEIGCGTGTLTKALSKSFKNVEGADLDAEMVDKARSKYPELTFKVMDMLKINEFYTENQFDALVCFGNTLVHLPNKKTIAEFLRRSLTVLKLEGKLLIQIINYDRVLDQQIKNLPTIENEHIQFIRDYELVNGMIEFKTKLMIKSTGEQVINSVDLVPLRKTELEILLKETGYSNIRFYGGFNKEPLNEKSIPLVVEAQKY